MPRDYVSGRKPPFKIQPAIDHPAFCSCTKCSSLPLEERGRPHSWRIYRASTFPDDRLQTALYARRVKAEEEAKLRGEWVSAADDVTFGHVFDLYIDEHQPGDRDVSIIEVHLRPFFGKMAVASTKAIHVLKYQRERSASASPATINREWNVLRACLNFAELHEVIPANPIKRRAVKLLETAGPRRDFFEPDEWRRFVTAFDDENRWKERLEKKREGKDRRVVSIERQVGPGGRRPDSEASRAHLATVREAMPVLRTCMYVAARLGEVIELRWRDVDLKRRLITVHQEKTRKPKTLPIVHPLQTMLEGLDRGLPDAYVFTRGGRPFYERELQRAFDLALTIAGVDKPLTPHSIRHTVGSWLVIAGYGEDTHVAEILGHRRSRVTSGYAHLAKTNLVPAMNDLVRIESEGFKESESGALTAANDSGRNAVES